MELVTKGLDNDKIICVWVMKLEIFHFTYGSLKSHTTKINSNFCLFIFNKLSDSFFLLFCFSIRREYLPITMQHLQLLIDTSRLDTSKPIDLTQICNTGIFDIKPDERKYGFQLKDEGIEFFKSKINIEVQYATELVIATIEKHGGIIRTAYYDMQSLWAMRDTKKFFEKGVPIPRRMLPPQDAVAYYSDPKNRGYLADPEEISKERQVLAQKYGYDLPKIENDPNYEMLTSIKDPRQVFYGLEPGWIVNLVDKTIIKKVIEVEQNAESKRV